MIPKYFKFEKYPHYNFYFILSLAFIVRIALSFVNFGGDDAINAADLYSFIYNKYDYYTLYHKNSPPPYLPFSIFIYFILGKTADFINIHFVSIAKLQATFFDLCIGILIYFYIKKINKNKARIIFLIYAFNPLTLFITSQLGFNDSMVIFLLLLCCYLSDNYKNNNFLIPFFLTLSLCIKPFTFIFFPYFNFILPFRTIYTIK